MAILLIGLVATWPLMHASVAAEAEDMLDALSRSFSYFNQRLGKFAGYVVVAWLLGIAGLLLVDLVALATLHLTSWGVHLTAPASSLVGLVANPALDGSPGNAGSNLPVFWRAVVEWLVRGWIFTYFWTSSSFVYLILRHDVDGTPMTDVKAPVPPASDRPV